MTITVNGVKLYPVGKHTTYQHVFYNHNDRCYNRMIEANYTDETVEAFDKSERLLKLFDTQIKDGMVYANFNDYKAMKDIINGYAHRHGGRI